MPAFGLAIPLAVAGALTAIVPASAQTVHRYTDSIYAYCANSRGAGMQYKNCSFRTLADCLEELKGLGGDCQPNPYYVAPVPAPEDRRLPPKRHRHRAPL